MYVCMYVCICIYVYVCRKLLQRKTTISDYILFLCKIVNVFFLHRKVITKNSLKKRPFGILASQRDWIVSLKMVAKMSGHWPNGLPPRILASYIEDPAKNFIFRTESQCHGSLPESKLSE